MEGTGRFGEKGGSVGGVGRFAGLSSPPPSPICKRLVCYGYNAQYNAYACVG